MTHQGMQEEQAWQTLRKMAMDKNQRMVEIARALLMVKAIWPLTPASRCTIDGHSLPAGGALLGEKPASVGKKPASALLPKLASRLHY